MSENVIPTITIDGTEYIIDQLSDDHKNVINHMQIADQEIAWLQTTIAILTTGIIATDITNYIIVVVIIFTIRILTIYNLL